MSIDTSNNVTHIVKSLNTAANEDLVQRLSSWFSAPNPASNLNAAQIKRQEDTGVWLLRNPVFLGWEIADHSLLWLHGKAGSGKTVLSSTVIRYLLDGSDSDSVVTYFYFDFQTHEKQSYRSLLNSLVVQLFNQNGPVTTIIEELYNACDRGRSKPTIQDTLVVLRHIIHASALPVYVVVDALDECRDRRTLLGGLQEIRSWNQENLHIFLTSRRETEIEDTVCHLATDTISLEESVVDKDILTYIRYQLRHDDRLSKWSEEIQEEIETALMNGANGMFRWVECQLDAIRGCMKLGLLRKALRTLPKTLDETYARILSTIPEEHVEDARRILSCLICAFCPLATEEIAETLAVVIEGEPYYDVESRLQDPRDIITICSGLVSMVDFRRRNGLVSGRCSQTTEMKVLRLSHFSVKEYLTSDRIAAASMSRFALDERYTHELLANLCINYLLRVRQAGMCQDAREWVDLGRIPQKSAFAFYAASYWSHHLQAAQLDRSAPLNNRCLKLFTCPALLRDVIWLRGAWFQEGVRLTDSFCREYLFDRISRDDGSYDIDIAVGAVPPLYYASMLGLDELILRLLAAGEDIDSVGPGLTCLAAAAFFGYITTVQLLLDKGAKVNGVVQDTRLEGSHGWGTCYSPTAIYWAATTGQEDIVKMLLAKGADVKICRTQLVNPQRNDYPSRNTPLEAAVAESGGVYTRIVQLLLDAGADVDVGGDRYPANLLCSLIYNGDVDLVTKLLDASVDPDGETEGKRPLPWEIQGNLLIELGADLENIDSRLISVLYELRFLI